MPRSSDAVWDHFLLISESGRKKQVTCNYCNAEYQYAQASRLQEHLSSKCKNCPSEVKKIFKSKRPHISIVPVSTPSPQPSPGTSSQALTTTLISSTPPTTPSEPSTSATITTSNESHIQSTLLDATILESTLSQYTHEDVDTAVARAIYASGVPLSLLESEYWKDVFKLLDPSYTVPSRHCLSNPLLEAEYVRIKKEIDAKISKAMALGLILDGWTNIVGKGVINFIITTPQPIFYNAIYPGTECETATFLSEKIINIIVEIGPAKFVAVITDNAANMKAAWRIVSEKFPHISCVGCVSHALNLIYKDIFNISLFKETLDKVIIIIKYIKRTHVVHSFFEKCQAEKYGRTTTSLKLFSKTRWSGAYITLQAFKDNREALELLAISREINLLSEIKTIILDHLLWIKIEETVKILQPVAMAILTSENNNSLLSEVLRIFTTLGQKVSQELQTAEFVSETEKNAIMSTIAKRKDFCVQPIHYAAYQLDPRYCGAGLNDNEVSLVFEYLRKISAALGFHFGKVLKNMAEFKLKENFFDEAKAIWGPVNELEPRLWWRTFARNQDVADIAIKILSVPPSSAACERNWSLFARTHTKIRNRLNDSRTVKLMAIRSNLSLLSLQSLQNATFLDISEENIDDSDCNSECGNVLEENNPLCLE